MAENIPRRLRRFYRQKGAAQNAQNTEQPQEERYEETGFGEEGVTRDAFSFNETSEADKKRNLDHMPSMEYEDLSIDEKNLKDLKAFQKKAAEEALAQKSVEQFKQQNNRLPNKNETEQIADTLYTQLKDNPLEGEGDNRGEEAQQTARGLTRREQRRQRTGSGGDAVAQGGIPQEQRIPSANQAPQKTSAQKVPDIKALLDEETQQKKTESGDEFDLGLDEEGSATGDADALDTSADSIEDLGTLNLNLEQQETCPRCKKGTDKVIYCPKCGTAYCTSCAKSVNENEVTCPSCGTKTKI